MPKLIALLTLIAFVSVGAVATYIFANKESLELNATPETKNEATSEYTYISPISVEYLRSLNITTNEVKIESNLLDGVNYSQYIASFLSEGYKVYGLLTVPKAEMPAEGFPAIVFLHGYIPPKEYVTTEKYVQYVGDLAKNGFVVFKIDFRGNGNSEGDSSGSYFSSAYTIDAISALKSLQQSDNVNPNKIGVWGHSMAGNTVLRAMEVSPDFKAGVIWAGAVYSYKDFVDYGLNDSSYVHRPDTQKDSPEQKDREVSPEIQKIRSDPDSIDFQDAFWSSISLTANIKYLESPLQINHAVSDPVVSIDYSRDLVEVLQSADKEFEFHEYPGGGHNIVSPYYEQAMERTIDFFNKYLK